MLHIFTQDQVAPAARKQTRLAALTGLARRLLLAKLNDLERGCLTIHEPDDTHTFKGSMPGPTAEIRVDHMNFYPEAAFGGSIGAAESYMQGHWTSPDLTEVVRLMVVNRSVLDGMDSGLARLGAFIPKLFHRLHRNTVDGSKRNIVAHYDLSNEFFSLWLDPTMSYSSAVFEREEMTLEQASIAKLDRICRKLQLTPGDHLVEIGSGWGALAIHAATHYGCRVTTTTISDNQYNCCRERITAAGLDDRITLLKQDYRDLTGTYDKLVSVEMIEAVGWEYYDTFFETCSNLLRDDGLMLLQAITIDDRQYETAKRSVDFIQRYIFPGSCIPSVSAIMESVVKRTDMRLFHHEDITPSYARTLREWRRTFMARRDDVRELGFSEAFIRMWEFYLCYCEGGFTERVIGDVHMVFEKPMGRHTPILGALSS